MIDQALQRTAEHHTGEIVVAKDHVLLTAACCQDTTFGAHLEQPIAMNHGQIMIGKPAVTESVSEHFDTGMRCDFSDERLSLASYRTAIDGKTMIGQGTAQLGLFMNEQNRGTALSRLERSTETSRARANHRHIAKQILLVLILRAGRQIDHAEPRRFANHALPPVPNAERLIKSAVIKAYGQEATKPINDGITIRH